jgi:predicted nucleic acid-binding protein
MARGDPPSVPRLFLDSGVFLEGVLAQWSVSRAILIHARCRSFSILLAEYVQMEVEKNLLAILAHNPALATEAIDTYDTLLQLLKPERIPLPTKEELDNSRHLMRHQADVPVLVSALNASPDWLLTTNTRHFTPQVAARTGLKIATPQAFLQSLTILG